MCYIIFSKSYGIFMFSQHLRKLKYISLVLFKKFFIMINKLANNKVTTV